MVFFQNTNPNTQKRRTLAVSPWSFLCPLMINVTNTIHELRPRLGLPYYLDKSLRTIERELLTANIDDQEYRLLAFLIRDQVIRKREAIDAEDWEDISFTPPFDALLSSPCKMVGFFFRLIVLLLSALKITLKREERIQIAMAILQEIGEKSYPCSLNTNGKCSLNAVFQHYRKYEIKAGETCPKV